MNKTRRKHKRKGGSIKSNARKKISTQTKKVFAYCPICIERIHKEDRAETICGHFFHRKCINAWCLSKVNSEEDCECPVCRSYLFDMTNLANMKIANMKIVEKANKNLLSACISGNLEDFNKAIDNGANINVKSKTFLGYTPVHNASSYGHSEIVKLLIEKGANINAKDKIGDTSLHMAIHNKNLVIVKLLIQAGADINAKTDLEFTPLHLAVQKKEGLEYAKLLLEADAEIDAKERPERPIPSGQVSKDTVFAWGFGLLATGLMLLIWIGRSFPDSTGMWPAIGGLGLAATIVTYNRNHKGNPISPVIMGLCRVFVYITTGLCFTLMLGQPVLVGCLLILAYLIGLTYTAKQENLGHVKNLWPLLFLGAPVVYGGVLATDNLDLLPFWSLFTVWVLVALFFVKRRGPGDIPRAVVSLIAGMCLLDALLIASTGQLYFAGIAVGGFVLTLIFQKFIPGT